MKCRICKGKTVKAFSLGKIAISNFTKTPQDGHKMPLDLTWCPKCTLLQLARNFDRNQLYKHYWYRSAQNPVIVKNLKYIASKVKGQFHIDIGGNDGTLLGFSKAKDKLSVDPSNVNPNGYKWAKKYWEDGKPEPVTNTITAIAVLYASQDLHKFMGNVKKALAPKGIFISQLMTLSNMIENNDIGNICHEHVIYPSYKSLVKLFEQNGLEIYKVEKNTINGGSYLIYARHYKKGSIKFKEKEYTLKDIKAFYKRCCVQRDKMREFILKNEVAGFGASTKANTILQWYGIEHGDILGIEEIDDDKLCRWTIGSKLYIFKESHPEWMGYYWVFPYGFIKYFKKKHPNYKFVTSIPYVHEL